MTGINIRMFNMNYKLSLIIIHNADSEFQIANYNALIQSDNVELIIVSNTESNHIKSDKIQYFECEAPIFSLVNKGIINARGDYVGIIETSDVFNDLHFDNICDQAIRHDADFIKCNHYDIKNNKPAENKERLCIPRSETTFSIKQNPQFIFGDPSLFAGIVKRKLLLDKNIEFSEDDLGYEQFDFFFKIVCASKKMMWIPDCTITHDSDRSVYSRTKQPYVALDRMKKCIEVIKNNGCLIRTIEWRIYAQCIKMVDLITKSTPDELLPIVDRHSQSLLRACNPEIIESDFSSVEKQLFFKYTSPISTIRHSGTKILIYNWLPFDNPWNWGGGVTVYCKNIISEFTKTRPDIQIYFLSSGFAYSADTTSIYYRRIPNVFGDQVKQYEIVNSPIPAEQRYLYVNPTVALYNDKLKVVFSDFIKKHGPFQAIHFNNIEGISLDVLDLKHDFKDCRFIYSLHNYVPLCVNGSYYMRHKHCVCSPNHTAKDCMMCTRADIRSNIASTTYGRGLFGLEKEKCIPEKEWIDALDLKRLDENVSEKHILDFSKTAINKINENCDMILAVSKKVYKIAAENGLDERKMIVSYIGTKVAIQQLRSSNSKHMSNNLKIVFLGNDLFYEEKGYPFLIEALKQMEESYASKIDLVLTVRNKDYSLLTESLSNYHSLKIINGYTHSDLPNIFEGCDLSLVPVVWEDNLPQIAIESVAYGVPVLSSSAGGASELCEDDQFSFKAGDVEDFLNHIKFFVDNPQYIDKYWDKHSGLVTLRQHLSELIQIYQIPEWRTILSAEDYAYLVSGLHGLKHLTDNTQTTVTIPLTHNSQPEHVIIKYIRKIWRKNRNNT